MILQFQTLESCFARTSDGVASMITMLRALTQTGGGIKQPRSRKFVKSKMDLGAVHGKRVENTF